MTTTAKSTDNNGMSFVIFAVGAIGYSAIEYMFRGYTHWSMALTGGACLLAFYYYIRENKEAPVLVKAAVGACIFTAFEFCVGLLVNVWYGWDIWDYSRQPGNILGQICPRYSFMWFLICLAVILIFDIIINIKIFTSKT